MHAAGWNTVGGDGNIRNAGQLEKALEATVCTCSADTPTSTRTSK